MQLVFWLAYYLYFFAWQSSWFQSVFLLSLEQFLLVFLPQALVRALQPSFPYIPSSLTRISFFIPQFHRGTFASYPCLRHSTHLTSSICNLRLDPLTKLFTQSCQTKARRLHCGTIGHDPAHPGICELHMKVPDLKFYEKLTLMSILLS